MSLSWSYSISIFELRHFLSACVLCFRDHCHLNFTEQHTQEQHDSEAIADDMSNLDTNIIDASDEAVQSKDVCVLSLVDDFQEIIMEKSFPEEEILDAITEEDGVVKERDDSEKYSPG